VGSQRIDEAEGLIIDLVNADERFRDIGLIFADVSEKERHIDVFKHQLGKVFSGGSKRRTKVKGKEGKQTPARG